MEELAALTNDPLAVRLVAGVVGVVLLFAGARVYEWGLRLSAFLAGLIGVITALHLVSPWLEVATRPEVVGVGGIVGGLVAVATTVAVHRLALSAVGAVAGAVAAASLASALALAWWVPVVGSAVGALLFPLLFRALLVVTTPLVGAVGVAWAAGHADAPWIVGGLWLLGALVQVGLFRGTKRREAEEEEG